MTTKTENSPRVYVGTYAKYNAGSIKGAWLDLEDYRDAEDFRAACLELHKDEEDPELMFQDFESFPREYYGESSLSDDLWNWLDLSEHQREIVTVYLEEQGGTIKEALDAYGGTFDSPEHWAEDFLNDTGTLSEIPENLRQYFDFKAYARDAEQGGGTTFIRHDGKTFVFHRN